MKLVIHGIKGGYNIFTPDKIINFDARPDYNTADVVGQTAYSIHFDDKDVVFSKYQIIRDVRGDKRTGNIAFCLALKPDQMLPGKDIKDLIDQMAEEYNKPERGYIKDDNLYNIREDWDFLDKLRAEYKSKRTPRKQYQPTYQQGAKDAAFVYYESDEKLQKYFELPFQPEYNAHRQVFFIDQKDPKPNTLNSLRHDPNANLTTSIDLSDKYSLIIKNPHITTVKFDGKELVNGQDVKLEGELDITWAKEYHETISEQEGWAKSEYVTIDDTRRTVTIKTVELKPITYTFYFDVKDIGRDTFTINIENTKTGSTRTLDYGENLSLTEEDLAKGTWEAQAITRKSKGKRTSKKHIIKKEDKTISLTLLTPPPPSPVPGPTGSNKSEILMWVGIIVGMLGVIILLIWLLFSFLQDPSTPPSTPPTNEEGKGIVNYLEGIELQAESLNSLKERYCQEDPKHSSCTKLELAIGLRKYIDNGDIKAMKKAMKRVEAMEKDEFKYSDEQKVFKEAIDSIPSQYQQAIQDTLKNCETSTIDLDSIARLITKTKQALLEVEITPTLDDKKDETKIDKNKPKNEDPKKGKTTSNEKTDKELLEEKFWALINKHSKTKKDYKDLYDDYIGELPNDPYVKFLYKINKKKSEKKNTFDDFKVIKNRYLDSAYDNRDLTMLDGKLDEELNKK